MEKEFYKKCIEEEVYSQYRMAKGRLSIFDKIWCKYLNPELNALYLIRRKQFFEEKGGVFGVLARFYHVALMRRYGIHITTGTKIGIGLRIAHPSSIMITLCEIGDYFTIYQNCTVGQKMWKSGRFPIIGNNVTMYAGSMIIGDIRVADGVILGANSTLLKDADIEGGVYCGTPAKAIPKKQI